MKYRTEIALGVVAGCLLFAFGLGANILPWLVILGALYLVWERLGAGGGRAVGVLLAKETRVESISFDDIGGHKIVKQELLEALDFINGGDSVQTLGIRPLKGILLSGPPGTGKTLLAKAAAAYTDAVFIAAGGSEFVEMYAGVGAKRVRQIFSRARAAAGKEQKTRALVFIDEIEVLGGQRGRHSGHLEYDQTLNQLLVEMDGIEANREVQILVIAATNRADLLDPALLRPGRFDRIVKVDLPEKAARWEILKVHTRHKPISRDVDLSRIAEETYGFSGAHLESLVNEAAIFALRSGKTVLEQVHFLESMEKVLLGEINDFSQSPDELLRISLHEAGHALLAEHARPGAVAAVTILSRGDTLGFVRQTQGEGGQHLQTAAQIREQLAVLLAGAAAEELVLGERSTGASGDFRQAAALAKRYVLAGLSPLGIVDAEVLPKSELHEAVRHVLQAAEAEAMHFLIERRHILEKVADSLRQEERLSGQRFRELLATAS